jgi:hypothetical protein
MVIVLVVLIILGGGLYIGSLMYDAYKRSNINYDEYNWGFSSQDSQEMASSNSNQSTTKKPRSNDRTCRTSDSMLGSMYKSVSSTASSIEDSIQSSSTTLMSDITQTAATSGDPPSPAAPSSSISAASTATTSTGSHAAPPSVQSKVSESFMLQKVPRKYFSEGVQGATPFTIEDNYGKI